MFGPFVVTVSTDLVVEIADIFLSDVVLVQFSDNFLDVSLG